MEVTLKENERIDDLELDNLKIIQNNKGFCFGMDSVLLSDFAKEIKPGSNIIDLGTGTGILPILLSSKTKDTKITGIEIQKEVAEMANRSIMLNNLQNRVQIICENIKNLKQLYSQCTFDSIVTNPPYKKSGTGGINIEETKLISRHEVTATLEDFISISQYLLKDKGSLYLVHRPERLADIITKLCKYKLEPEILKFVQTNSKKEPNLILIKAVKNAKPHLKICKPLYIYNEDGSYTDELLKIYNKGMWLNMKGTIYLVATPIGNLEDITYRAIKILKEVDIIAAEDTRHTLQLLNHFEISKQLISYHRHNEEAKTQNLISMVLEGKNIAIVTDAGTPGISDPGEEIVKQAIKEQIEIIPIPGACALINSLIVSGISTKEFSFFGFLPLNKTNRKQTLEKIRKEQKTVILYEAPHKLQNTLQDILEKIGDVNVCLVRELTKIHEEKIYGKISELIELCKEPKGEFVIILDLNEIKNEEEHKEMTLEEQYEYYEKQGLNKKDIIKQIAKDRKVNKNEIYQKFLNKK